MMKQNKLYILFSMFFTFSLLSLGDMQKIEEYFNNIKDFSGAVSITQNDTVLFKKTYGYAQREFQILNDCSIKFNIASNTKSFTAVAIMILHEKGLLAVTDKVNKYIAGIPDSVTIHHLLTHTSGIPNYYSHWDDMRACNNLDEMVGKISGWKLEFEPGQSYAYCNSGYLLLAHIIEKVSKMRFEEFLQEHIFKPLTMINSGSICKTTDASTLHVIDKKASGYVKQADFICGAPSLSQPLALLGNGDLYASIDDMTLWVQELFAGKILNAESLETLLSCHVAMEGSLDRFHAYGWFIDKQHDKQVAEYSGALVGYLSKVVRFIDDNITIVVLTNVEDRDQFLKICDDLPKMVMQDDAVKSEENKRITL